MPYHYLSAISWNHRCYPYFWCNRRKYLYHLEKMAYIHNQANMPSWFKFTYNTGLDNIFYFSDMNKGRQLRIYYWHFDKLSTLLKILPHHFYFDASVIYLFTKFRNNCITFILNRMKVDVSFYVTSMAQTLIFVRYP